MEAPDVRRMVRADEELMMQVVTGDAAAFDELFWRYQMRLFRFAMHALRDREEAEDACQVLFLRLWRHRRSFRGGSFATWIYSLARNAVRDAAKKMRKREICFSELPDEEMELIEARQVSAFSSRIAFVDEVRLAIQQMRESQRSAIILRECGHSYEEIAVMLGCSISKARVLTCRARKSLRLLLLAKLKGDDCEQGKMPLLPAAMEALG